MPASKKEIFTKEERQIALIGRAKAHPARIRILAILNKHECIRNCDLTHLLKLSKSTIHDHLQKLTDAELIRTEYFMNSYVIFKNENFDNESYKNY